MAEPRTRRQARASREAEGATSVEYAILAASIAVVIIAAVLAIGIATDANFGELLDRWPG